MALQVFDANRARTKWRDIVDAAHSGQADIIIERYGKAMVAVIAYEDYLALAEELDDLRAARRATLAYEEWRKNPVLGRTWEAVEAEMISDGLLDEHA